MFLARPYLTVVLAMSADGKIADRDRAAARFSSAEDLTHLEVEVARADGVLFGAGTLHAYGTCMPVRQRSLIIERLANGQPEQPVQIVYSRSGNLDKTLRFFRQSVPRWLLTTDQGARQWEPGTAFERILQLDSDLAGWEKFLHTLWNSQIRRLAVLGGGTLVGSLVAQDLIDELHLTVCPVLLGGQTAPTPVDGVGLPVDLALKLELITVKAVGQEVFLHYRRCHPKED